MHYPESLTKLWRDKETGYVARIEAVEAALKLIANHRKECHEHDDDMGHPLRDFDGEDWRLVEYAARTALAKEPTE